MWPDRAYRFNTLSSLFLLTTLVTWISLGLAMKAPGLDAQSGALTDKEQQWQWPWLDPNMEWSQEELPEERPVSAPDTPDNQTEGTIRVDGDQVVIKCNLTRETTDDQEQQQSNGGSSLSNNKVKRAITEEERNALEKRARDIRCHSPGKATKLIISHRDRRPEKKRLNQMVPGDSIDRLMFGGREPRWMDECNLRPPKNDTILRLWLPSRRSQSSAELVSNLLRYGTYLRSRHTKENDDIPSRRKRSVSLALGSKTTTDQEHQHQLYKFQDSGKSAILFRTSFGTDANRRALLNNGNNRKMQHQKKQPVAGSKWWLPKKTTFAFSRPKEAASYHYFSGNNNNYKSQKSTTWSKNRFLVSFPNEMVGPPLQANQLATNDQHHGEIHTTATATTITPTATAIVAPATKAAGTGTETGQQQQANVTAIQGTVINLFQLDGLMSWRLVQAYKTVKDLRKHIEKVLEVMLEEDSYKQAANVSEQRRQQILDQRKWMPKFEELVAGDESVNRNSLYNVTSGLHQPEVQAFMHNMTSYIQLFSVAVEQMLYDRQFFYGDSTTMNNNRNNNIEHYRALEKDSQMMLCEAKNLFNLFEHWHRERAQFYKLHETEKLETISGVGEFYDKFINKRLVRDRPIAEGFQPFESPLDRAWGQLTAQEQNDKLRQLELLLPENMVKKDRKYMNTPPEQRPQPVIVRHLTYPSHFWRDIMPLEQRQLYTAKERAIRDTSILQDMQLFLRSYGTLVYNNSFE